MSKQLYQLIYDDLTLALKDLQQQTQGQHWYSLGLGLVGQVCGYFVAAHTLEQIKANPDPHTMWWIAEWAYESQHHSPGLQAYLNEVDEQGEQYDDEQEQQYDAWLEAFLADYQQNIILALQSLRQEGQLKNAQGEELIVILQYADAHDEDFEEHSFSQINDPSLFTLYVQRFKHTQPNLTQVLQQRSLNLNTSENI